jgi:hypothetical protein
MQGDKAGRIETVSAYKFDNAVKGEFATSGGLVEFEYPAGEVMPKGDEDILAFCLAAGVASIVEPKATSKKQDTVVADAATEEN